MLIRFMVENHRSIRDPVEVSFAATRIKDLPDHRFRGPGAPDGALPGLPHGILPAIGVFGANASGKSNIVGALAQMSRHVERSFRLSPHEPPPYDPFFFTAGAPTTFEVDFLVAGVRHHYGFQVDRTGYPEEWLYRWPGRNRQLVFKRSSAAEVRYQLGAGFSGRRQAIADATRPNALLLSTAVQLNHTALGEVAAVLTKIVESEQLRRGVPLFAEGSPLLQPEHRTVIGRALRAADLGVVDFEPRPFQVDTRVVDPGGEPHESSIRRLLKEANPQELWLKRQAAERSWTLPPSEESRGTLALLVRLNDLLPALRDGRTLVIDEIDSSLHPDVCSLLVHLFTHPDTNPRGAQLLFTTHDRGLLQQLRRDEVLLVDKSPDGSTRVRSASDFAGVRQRDDLRRLHEQGLIGGTPALGPFAHAFERLGHGR